MKTRAMPALSVKVVGFSVRVFSGSLVSRKRDSTRPDTNGSTGHP